MRKCFILMLLILNMVYFNQAVAVTPVEQAVLLSDEDKQEGSEEEENPEDDCD